MENKKFSKKQLIIAALAGALGYSLFGPIGLILVGLWYAWKMLP